MSTPSSSKLRPADVEAENDSGAHLPQYGFSATYKFDELVEHNRFLFRVHTPHTHRSRAPSPGPSIHRPALSRSPSSLSTSISSLRSGHDSQDEDAASADPYFLSRRFKDDLGSPDPGVRRRTLSTLSTLSGGTYIGSDYDESDNETAVSRLSLSRSTSMSRMSSISRIRPMHGRSQSVELVGARAPPPPQSSSGGADMTYDDLVRHLDWTTRSSSPYVTTSFSFFWCLWEAVRRYKLAVKHDVEIAVIDSRKVVGRAKTALEVLRGVESGKQDKSYWKWYRFALESQDVLVFGAIPGDAIYASIPLSQIIPKLSSYFFKDDPSIPKTIDAPLETGEEDPRSPSSRRPRSPDAHSQNVHHHHEHQHQHHERTFSPKLLASLAWDVGTSLKPSKHSRSSSQLSSSMYTSPSKKTHTSHREFCGSLTAAFLSPSREHAARLLDATTGAVRLAECLVEPWFRAQCALSSGYPFHHDSDSDSEHEHACGDAECIGLAGDGCALKTKSGTAEDDEAKGEAANILQDLALYIARWPAAWWYAEHAGEVEGVVSGVVDVCVREAALGVGARVNLDIEREFKRTIALARSDSEKNLSQQEERRGRGEKRDLSKTKTKHPGSLGGSPKPWPTKGTPMGTPNHSRARSPLGISQIDAPSLAPAFELKSKSDVDNERKLAREESDGDSVSSKSSGSLRVPGTPPASVMLGHAHSTPGIGRVSPSPHIKWSETLSTPPPTPPRTMSGGSLHSGRRSPPPPPPPRSRKRISFPGSSTSSTPSSSALPTPRTSPASSLRIKESPVRPSLDRGEPLPGGWPGSDSEAEAEEGEHHEDDRGDVIVRRPRHRPMSWAGTALGALGAAGLGVAFAEKNDSQSSDVFDMDVSRPRARTRTLSHGALKQSALQEAVETILRSSTPEVSPKEEHPRENTVSRERPEAVDELFPPRAEMGLERRASNNSLDRRSELSPVREDPGEDEADAESSRNAVQDFAFAETDAVVIPIAPEGEAHDTAELPLAEPMPIISLPGAVEGAVAPLPSPEMLLTQPLASPKHERSRTLESIPEEEKEELSAISPKLVAALDRPWAEDTGPSGAVGEDVSRPQSTSPLATQVDVPALAADAKSECEQMESAPVLKRDASVSTDDGHETTELEKAVTDILRPESAHIGTNTPKDELPPVTHQQPEEAANKKVDGTPDTASTGHQQNATPRLPLPLDKTPTGFGWLRRRLSRLSSTMSLTLSGSPLSASSPVFEDDAKNFSILRTSSWAASCLLCGVIVTAVLISDRRQSIMIGNRYC